MSKLQTLCAFVVGLAVALLVGVLTGGIAIGAEGPLEAIMSCPAFSLPGLPPWAGPLLCVAYMGLEYWLGKTQKVKSGSALEVGLNAAKGAVDLLKKKPTIPPAQ